MSADPFPKSDDEEEMGPNPDASSSSNSVPPLNVWQPTMTRENVSRIATAMESTFFLFSPNVGEMHFEMLPVPFLCLLNHFQVGL